MRQYVGARYVPTFADPLTWDNSHSYEALIMVDYMGDTYTSKKPVPPGIAITNTEYWVMTGSFNSQLSEIRSDLDALEDRVDIVEPSLATAERVTGTLYPKKFIFISDSFGQMADSWIDKVISAFGLTASDYYKSAIGGNGFCDSAGSNGFKTQLTGLSVADPDSITDIVVVGGTNDIEADHILDLHTNITSFITTAKATYANARIFIGFAGTKYRAADLLSGIGKYRSMAEYYYKLACSENGCYYIGGIKNALSALDRLESDRIHPNARGCNVIGSLVNMTLRGWSTPGTYESIPLLVSGTIDNAFASGTFEAYCGSGLNKLVIKAGTYSKVAISAGNYYTLLAYADMPCVPMVEQRKIITIRVSGAWYKYLAVANDSGIQLVEVNSGQTVPNATFTLPEDIEFIFPC